MIRVLTILNVDEKTTQMEANGDFKANLVFSDKYKVFPIADITEVCLREPTNANTGGVITGVKVAGKWYGDGPNGEEYINPFTGEELTNGTPVPKFSWDKISAKIEIDPSGVAVPPFNSSYYVYFTNNNAQEAQAEIIATVTKGNGEIAGGTHTVTPNGSQFSSDMTTNAFGMTEDSAEYDIKVKVTYNGEYRILATDAGEMPAVLH